MSNLSLTFEAPDVFRRLTAYGQFRRNSSLPGLEGVQTLLFLERDGVLGDVPLLEAVDQEVEALLRLRSVDVRAFCRPPSRPLRQAVLIASVALQVRPS
jgi:hypothetical protein